MSREEIARGQYDAVRRICVLQGGKLIPQIWSFSCAAFAGVGRLHPIVTNVHANRPHIWRHREEFRVQTSFDGRELSDVNFLAADSGDFVFSRVSVLFVYMFVYSLCVCARTRVFPSVFVRAYVHTKTP